MPHPHRLVVSACLVFSIGICSAQEKSVRPGINDAFKNPNVKEYVERFEGESREVYSHRREILKEIGLKPGESIADVGAGTGFYSRLFASVVGEKGHVYAVDISENFLKHIAEVSRQKKIGNITTVLCKPDSAELKPNSVDVVFICDTYHHFEFPTRTLASIHSALKPGGRLALIDFHRIPGKSSEWTLNHVRAGQEVFEQEIVDAGFKKTREVKDLLKDNYLVLFEKVEQNGKASKNVVFPIIPGYGGVVPLPDAADQPMKGTKVVFDVTGVGKMPGDPAPGVLRAATLLNLAGASGLQTGDLSLAIVLHGDATFLALSDSAYRAKFQQPHPNAELIARLAKAGVRFRVCGQALRKRGIDAGDVRSNVTVSVSALTAVLHFQAQGYAIIPAN